MNNETTTEREITLREARKLCKPLGRLEPYRGYAYDLGNGRVIAHRPDGKLILREATKENA